MATVMFLLAAEADDAGDAAPDDAAAEDDAGAELAGLLDEPLLTEQPASASAATTASGRVPANETFLDIYSSFGTS
jgi:hypothetical protein